jgi:hypothetical protein
VGQRVRLKGLQNSCITDSQVQNGKAAHVWHTRAAAEGWFCWLISEGEADETSAFALLQQATNVVPLHEQPLVPPQLPHLKQLPLRTMSEPQVMHSGASPTS